MNAIIPPSLFSSAIRNYLPLFYDAFLPFPASEGCIVFIGCGGNEADGRGLYAIPGSRSFEHDLSVELVAADGSIGPPLTGSSWHRLSPSLALAFCDESLRGRDAVETLVSYAHPERPIQRRPYAFSRISRAHLARGMAVAQERARERGASSSPEELRLVDVAAVTLMRPHPLPRWGIELAAWLAHNRAVLGVQVFYLYMNCELALITSPLVLELLSAPDIVLIQWQPGFPSAATRAHANMTDRVVWDAAIQSQMFASYQLRFMPLHSTTINSDIDEFFILPEQPRAVLAGCPWGYVAVPNRFACSTRPISRLAVDGGASLLLEAAQLGTLHRSKSIVHSSLVSKGLLRTHNFEAATMTPACSVGFFAHMKISLAAASPPAYECGAQEDCAARCREAAEAIYALWPIADQPLSPYERRDLDGGDVLISRAFATALSWWLARDAAMQLPTPF